MADGAQRSDTSDESEPPAIASSSEFSETALVQKVTRHVKENMSGSSSCHDFDHVMRVLGLSRIIATSPLAKTKTAASKWNPLVLTLGALLHHIGDKGYIRANERIVGTVYQLLLSFGTPIPVAEQVQLLVNYVPYSAEMESQRAREHFRKLAQEIPELNIIQDADRLDTIGSIGVGRAFAYSGAPLWKPRPLQRTIAYFTETLEGLERSMKTPEGKRLALERTNRLKLFRGWWEEEMALARSGLSRDESNTGV
ncbi:HD domain-containing protein [Trichophyton interdigitale]|uniref:HD domain-containing protein n=1 Tax=Trichophyton interdigitale TaxID=101480 RepID=A0A9P4YHH6_9EURO|nr:HD domain-containing protein [Trichophyton interdigitale]KAF3895001.1 HD domain-containing protein [Trichophyton interdigitale]KAG8208607.1 HD domain-containing protein [Trichophyton interdigitale]